MTGKEKSKWPKKARRLVADDNAKEKPLMHVRHNDMSWRVWIWLLVALLTLIALYGCTRMVYVPVEHKTTETIETIVRDTIVEVVTPAERVEVVTEDTSSMLATRYAMSMANYKDGKLHHSLYQWARVDSISVPLTTIKRARRDSIPYPVEVEKVVEVVPAWSWWSLAIAGVCIAGVTLYIIGNIKKE